MHGPNHPQDIFFEEGQFQLPQALMSGTPNLVGDGTQTSSDYNIYENVSPSQSYSPPEFLPKPPSSQSTSRFNQTSRTFHTSDLPHEDEGAVTSSPRVQGMDIDEDPGQDYESSFIHESSVFHSYAASYAQGPVSFPSTSDPNLTISNFSLPEPTARLPQLPLKGLPLYSESGFDMLRILAKVATRPRPTITLGPVDMTCSFLVADVRQFDAPIVYASPTFSSLTGYSEAEVLGRNARFLQAPSGSIERGDERRYTSPDAIRHLQKYLHQEKECQVSLVNYRKDGGAFTNLLTIIPVATEDGSEEITHHIGFQVDLAKRTNSILQKLQEGSYGGDYSSSASGSAFAGTFGMVSERGRRGVSQEMVDLLSAHRPWVQAGDAGLKLTPDHERSELHDMLLQNTDDFIHVVSLRGSLLYVAPSVQRVLGYNAAELVGKSMVDICHPADIIPLLRDLKVASSTPGSVHSSPIATGEDPNSLFALPAQPLQSATQTSVNLLFRSRHKNGNYIWLESRGRMHGDQGKGRKAVVLVGRKTNFPSIKWGAVVEDESDADCWGLVAPNGLVLSASNAGAERLGYGADGMALVGRSLSSLIKPEESRRVGDLLAGAAYADKNETRRARCEMLMRRLEGQPIQTVSVEVVFYSHEREQDAGHNSPVARSLPSSLIFQIRFLDNNFGSPTIADSDSTQVSSTTLKSPVEDLPSWDTVASSSPSASRPHEQKRSHTSRLPDMDVLEELDTAGETSWQYELTRVRVENQRMREEILQLEHLQRTRTPHTGQWYMGLQGMGGMS